MRNKVNFFVSCLAFSMSSGAMAGSIVPLWECTDTMESNEMRVSVNVDKVVPESRSSYKMVVTVVHPDLVVKQTKYGPYSLTFKKTNPMTGVAYLEGFPLSFLFGSGEDHEHLFGQLFGEIEGEKVVINLNCKDLQRKAYLQ